MLPDKTAVMNFDMPWVSAKWLRLCRGWISDAIRQSSVAAASLVVALCLSSVSVAVVAKPVVSLSMDPARIAPSSAFVAKLSITNSAEAAVVVKDLCLQDRSVRAVDPSKDPDCNALATDTQYQFNCPTTIFNLEAGETRTIDCVARSTRTWLSTALDSSLWQSSVLPVDVQVSVAGEVERFAFTLPVSAHTSAVFMGGLLGAFLLACLIQLRKYEEQLPIRGSTADPAPKNWNAILVALKSEGIDRFIMIWRFLMSLVSFAMAAAVRSLSGGVCAIILLLLGRMSEGNFSPVQFVVSDFAGGVLVGLFALPIGSALMERFLTLQGDQNGGKAGQTANGKTGQNGTAESGVDDKGAEKG